MTVGNIGRSLDSITRAALCAALFFLAGCGGYIDGGDSAVFDENDFSLKSWINPNYLPGTVIETTL